MLRWRLVSAAFLISGLAFLLWLDYRRPVGLPPGAILFPLAVLGATIGVLELRRMLATRGVAPHAVETYLVVWLALGAAALPLAGDTGRQFVAWCGPLGPAPLALAAAVILLFAGEMARYREPGGVTQRIANGMLAAVYLGILPGYFVALRAHRDNAWGLIALLSMIAIVKLSDSGAYFAGRLFGRHPLAPLLSPKKTIEGSIGGVAASTLGAVLIGTFVVPWLVPDAPAGPVWKWASYGGALAFAGMAGDLAESLIKRDMGQKDAGQILPGMGGILDVLDSLLFGAPVATIFWTSGFLG
ncbi:MAG: Phosphatidate cytidylyltransferase [Planctomycetota bacterium]